MNFDHAKYGDLIEGPDGVFMVLYRRPSVNEVRAVRIRDNPSNRIGDLIYLTRLYPGQWLDTDKRGT
jgi:hypothetical protein